MLITNTFNCNYRLAIRLIVAGLLLERWCFVSSFVHLPRTTQVIRGPVKQPLKPIWRSSTRTPASRWHVLMTHKNTVSTLSHLEIEQIKGMRIKQLKEELKVYGIPINDVFEKEELVRRLVKAKSQKGFSNNQARNGSSDMLQVPMSFFALEASRSVSGTSSIGEIYLRPSPGQYPAIDLHIPNGDKLTMLVDTACSGIVLRPSSAKKQGMKIVDNPISMTSAGGTAETKLSQIDRFSVQGKQFGPSPIAVQDIGALPSQLDGILGLQFLSQFAHVTFDFDKKVLQLSNTEVATPEEGMLVGEGELLYTRFGVWAVNCILDGKGPVKMLLDTGAASSILNWKGVSDLGLNRSSPEVCINKSPIGAMGADNLAIQLTHRITFEESVKLDETSIGLSLGIEGSLDIDIGTLPILDMLLSDGVGGIIGSDALMRCSSLKLMLKGSSKKVYFYR